MPFRREDWELGPAVTVDGLRRPCLRRVPKMKAVFLPPFQGKNTTLRPDLAFSVNTVFQMQRTTVSPCDLVLWPL